MTHQHMRLCILIGLVFSVVNFAIAREYGFRHLSTENGISHNQVNDIYQDSEGFMWISTAWGLDRYDGYRVKNYQTIDGDTTSLRANFVHWARDIFGDKLYIRTSTGNCIYDKSTDSYSYDVSRFLPKGSNAKNVVTYVDRLYNV
ncbi:MAG: two-component regulator propeller domain-containing protein, partial [Bacteroidia bacterium]|nr:two-component regulator propeller domain-containing protein [Bacteroidia bacterium]